jgi:hypothetical protein
MVKLEDVIFLQGKHTYTFYLENFRNKNYTLGPAFDNLPNDPIQTVV